MNTTVQHTAIGFSFILRVGALVLFIITALFGFGLGGIDLDTILGLISAGLAAWVGSTLVP
jgi:hypothetical protein